MPHLDPSACEPTPTVEQSHLQYAQGFVDRLHQAVGELVTAQRRPDSDTHIETIAVSLLAYLLLTTSSGPVGAYIAAIQKIARDRAAADQSSTKDPEEIYADILTDIAAGTIGELLDAAHQTPGTHPMLVLIDAVNVYDELNRPDTD